MMSSQQSTETAIGTRSEVATPVAPSRVPIGGHLRHWRHQRRLSQLHLAVDVGVSTRHLSFVETGRARPSPELILAIAEYLDVPLRDRNTMLLAAGYAPRYGQRDLGDPGMRHVAAALQRMLDAHDPYPGVVIDRRWNVLLSNAAAAALTSGVDAALLTPQLNVFRLCLHPDGLAPRTVNFDEWATYLLRQLRRTIMLTGDAEMAALEAEVLAYPNIAGAGSAGASVADIGHGDDPPLLVPIRLRSGDGELSMFTTLTTFGTPRDVTLDELAVELFFPADDATAAALRRR